ncbi:MAG: hypothetical protein AAGF85_01550 [Bacteroidota bacterium]
MRKIIPYKTTKNAFAVLDNGGRFYNWSSKANDGNISSAELGKAVGAFSSQQVKMLYLEMAISDLTEEGKQQIKQSLTNNLKADLAKYPVKRLIPSQAKSKAQIGESAIITGIPRLIDAKTKFTGFIMIPVITNNVTTFIMVPIFEKYDVYALRDSESSKEVLIAHSKRAKKLPEQMLKCGGILKELKADDKKNSKSDLFLETLYYSEIIS